MTEQQLHELGLSPSQAKAYILLVLTGKLAPADLMSKTGESRTNAYMVLDRLVDLGLAFKDEVNKKLVYRASSPAGLQKLAERQRTRALETEQKIKAAMPGLLRFFNEHRVQPGVRFLQGREALTGVYQDHLKDGTGVCVFRTTADDPYYGDELYEYMTKREDLGIKTDLISPATPGSLEFDQRHPNDWPNRKITWTPPEAYTAPVEISIYGSKVAITSFGEEAVATIIESPQIADALRQIFAMAKAGAEAMYKQHK